MRGGLDSPLAKFAHRIDDELVAFTTGLFRLATLGAGALGKSAKRVVGGLVDAQLEGGLLPETRGALDLPEAGLALELVFGLRGAGGEGQGEKEKQRRVHLRSPGGVI